LIDIFGGEVRQNAVLKLRGALLMNEWDVQLFEQLVFLARQRNG
jgi:hypothetical protein